MAYYRKRPVLVKASVWNTNGDHPDDESHWIASNGDKILTEGRVVRYYRHPATNPDRVCVCGHIMHDHGWIDAGMASKIVCPGDVVVTRLAGASVAYTVMKPDAFAAEYEPVVIADMPTLAPVVLPPDVVIG